MKRLIIFSVLLLLLVPSVMAATTSYTLGDGNAGSKVGVSKVGTDIFRFQTVEGDKTLDLRLGAQLTGGGVIYMSDFLQNNPGTTITFPVTNKGGYKKYDMVVDPAPNLANVEYIFLEYYDHSGFQLSSLNFNSGGVLADVLELTFEDAISQNLTVNVDTDLKRITIGQLENAVVDGVLTIDPTVSYNPNATGSSAWWEGLGGVSPPGTWTQVDANSYSGANLNTVSINDTNYVFASSIAGIPPEDRDAAHRFKIKINSSSAEISNLSIVISHAGLDDGGGGNIYTYIGNVTGTSWNLISTDAAGGGTRTNIAVTILDGFTDYVEDDAGNYYIYVLDYYDGSPSSEADHYMYYLQAVVESAPDETAPVVSLVGPANGTSTYQNNVFLNASFSDGTALANSTLLVWNSTGNLINSTTTTITGLTNTTNVNYTFPYTGVFYWNYNATDSNGNVGMNATNYTITYTADYTFKVSYNYTTNAITTVASNVTDDGLRGYLNLSGQFGSIGTILGIALLLSLIFVAFQLRQN